MNRRETNLELRALGERGEPFELRGPVPAFSGSVDFHGQWSYNHNSDSTKPCVTVHRTTGAVAEVVGPVPTEPDPDYIWFPKATTYGDIHVF
jgi:hypothetical protein